MNNELAATTTTPPAKPDPLRQVVHWLVSGKTDGDIRDAVAATFPQVSIEKLMSKAAIELQKSGSPDMQLVRGFAIEGTRECYRKALELNDLSTALRALKQLIELAEED